MPLLYSQESSINSSSGSIATPSMSIDYVVGEPFFALEDTSGAFTPIPLAVQTDSTNGIWEYNGVSLQVFPNPANAVLYFSIGETGTYRLELLNINGERIAVLYDEYLSANTIAVLDISKLQISTGTYYLHITSNTLNTYASVAITR